MAKDNEQIAIDVLEAVGGKENVTNALHCMTRLRLNLRDSSIDDEKVKAVNGVIGVNRQGEQYQIVIGTNVTQVYEQFCKIANLGTKAAIDENLDADVPKQPLTVASFFNGALDYLSGSMAPMVPAFMAVALFKTIQAVCGPTLLNLFSAESDFYFICDSVFNAAMYFMPIMLGYTAAKKIDVEPVLGMLLGAILMEPNFVGRVGAVAAGEAAPLAPLFGLSMRMNDYSQTVIPILISMWVLKYVYNFFKKVIPQNLNAFTPFLTFLVVYPIAMYVTAPAGSFLADGIAAFFMWFVNAGGVVTALGLGLLMAVQPILVTTGMHVALSGFVLPIYTSLGYDPFIMVANLISNFATWAVALGAGIRAKNAEERGEDLGMFVSGFIGGVVEPTLFGLCTVKPKLFAGTVAGGLCAGLWCGFAGVKLYALAGSSVLSLLGFISPDSGANVVNAAIGAVIGFVVSLLVTLFYSTRDGKEAKSAA